jgi:leucyl-tRNA synthetase
VTHATGHLLYFRFFQKFLKDIGWLTHDEPAQVLFNHGMVMDADGVIMSKSVGNVTSPVTLMEERGVDVTRLAMYFKAPSEREVFWHDESLLGVEKFATNKLFPVIKAWRGSNPDLKQRFNPENLTPDERAIYVKLNQTIKKVSEDCDRLQFNTAISALMELVRDYDPDKIGKDELNDHVVLKTIQLIAPMAPHMAEEMWHIAGHETSVFKSGWPEYDPKAIVTDLIEIAVQINGKLRGSVEVSAEASQDEIETAAFSVPKIQAHTEGRQIVKKIYVKGRLLSLVVK